MTNGDKIRAMTDKEIAERMHEIVVCGLCPAFDSCSGGNCMLNLLEWLKEEAGE